MVCSHLNQNMLKTKNKHNVEVATWATQKGLGVAHCKFCGVNVSFKHGVKDLITHSEKEKHIRNTPKEPQKVTQLKVDEVLLAANNKTSEEKEVEQKARELEIDLARRFVRHKIPLNTIDCVVECLKSRVGDSKIIEKMSLGYNKAGYITKNAVGPEYFEETLELLKNCDGFSLALDESEINKESECEVLLRIAHKETGVHLRHYKTIDLSGGDAEVITTSLLDSFDDDGIDYKKLLLTGMSDGCRVMQGHLSGVKKRLADEVPQFKDLGSCNDHHLGNTMQKAVEAFDEDCVTAVMNTYQDIGGAKGFGLKKKKEFDKVADAMGVKTKAFKKLVSTRFRGIRLSIEPVLHNWEPLVAYYKSVKKPTERQKKLIEFYVDQEFASKLKLMFIMAATRELSEAIDYFERQETLLHENRAKLEDVLRSQISKFHDEQAIKILDEEGNVSKKTGAALLDFDIENKETLLKKKKVFIGQQAIQLIKDLDLSPTSPQVEFFYTKVYLFHKTAALFMQKYFDIGLRSTDLDYWSGLSPKNRAKVEMPHKVKYLAKTFSKIVENIRPGDGMDKIFQEIEEYNVDEDIKEVMDGKETYEQYWEKVRDMEEGSWNKYEVLPRFALVLATPFNSNSDVEPAFSVQSDIHRNPKKNQMLHDTLDAHMQIRYGIESKENKSNCDKCHLKEELRRKPHEEKTEKEKKMKPVCSCHCKFADISDKLKLRSRSAYKKNKEQESSDLDEENNSVPEEVKEKVEQALVERKEKLKEAMKARQTMYKAKTMKTIYETKEEKKKKEKEAKAAKRKNELASLEKALSPDVGGKKKRK